MMRRRGIRNFCHGDASTSTLQLHGDKKELGSGGDAASSSTFLTVPASAVGSRVAEISEVSGGAGGVGVPSSSEAPAVVTLEQMILQLDLEEEEAAAARTKARRMAAAEEEEEDGWCPRRMSCVDGGSSADHVLRSARDALGQYPRFSLDGRDAMYRASFSGYDYGAGRAGLGAAAFRDSDAIIGGHVTGGRPAHRPRASDAGCAAAGGYGMDLERTMPATVVAGESVVWCKPGVVARLMGLEAVPVPVRGGLGRRKASGPAPAAMFVGGGFRKQRLRRTGQEELAFQKERLFMALHGYDVVGAGACHAGAHRTAGGIGRNGDGWKIGLRR